MRNIDRVRTMDAAQLADFLVDHGAEVPNEFCDGLCEGESCEECPYVGEEGDRRAWKEWLESEYDGEEKEDDQEPQEPKRETATVSVGKSKGGVTMWYECAACGEPVDQGDTFCSGCGRRLIHE